jgi:L-threonylcarbamoyladenylate synthase
MAVEIIRLGAENVEKAFSRCRDVVRAGGIIVYPTDTYYGMGADPRNREAVKRIFALKKRSPGQPLLVLLADAAQVRDWAAHVSSDAERLMKQYWPGPLTLVFDAQPQVLVVVTGGTGSIGLRVPGNAVTRQLLHVVGTALTGTSANISGQPGVVNAEQAASMIGDGVDLILDAGPATGGKPSTLLDVRSLPFKVIRPGAIEI